MQIIQVGVEAHFVPMFGVDNSTLNVVRDRLQAICLCPELIQVEMLLLALNVPRYVIAGGYFRDKVHDVPFKDIDIFIPANGPREQADDTDVDYRIEASYVLTYRDLTLNFVRLSDNLSTAEVLSRMDIGLCQIGMDEQGQIVATQAFLDDTKNRTLTIKRRSESGHIERVHAKYPHFKLINESKSRMDLN
jgi:hypothetical protein